MKNIFACILLVCITSLVAETISLDSAHKLIEELETIRQNAPELFNEPEVLQAIQDLEEFLQENPDSAISQKVAEFKELSSDFAKAEFIPSEIEGTDKQDERKEAATRSKDNKILCSLLVKHNLVAQNLQVCNNTILTNLTVNGTITGNFPAPSVICGVPACTIANLIAGATSEDIPDTLVLRDGGSFAATNVTVTGQLIFEGTNGNFAAFQASASTANYTAILPPNTGSNGFVLQTDGGNPATLTWVAAGAGSGITHINGQSATTQFITTNSAGTVFNVTPLGDNATNQINIPYAGNLGQTTNVGLITGNDYYNFSHPAASSSTSGIQMINTATFANQFLITSSVGTAFAFLSSLNGNTLFVPYAGNLPNNATGVGLITGADYYNFSHPAASSSTSGIQMINTATFANQFLITSSVGTTFAFLSVVSGNTLFIPYAGNLPNNATGVGLITGADYYNFSHPSGSGITSINGANASTQTLITSSAGTAFQVVATSASNNTIFVPYAGNLGQTNNVGLITGNDYYNFSHISLVASGTTCDFPSILVLRDGTGSFVATTITLTGNSLINYSAVGGCDTGSGFIFAPTGLNNTIIGLNAGNNNTLTGTNNIALGFDALMSVNNGYSNVAIGSRALQNIVGGGAIGSINLGSDNIAIGYNTLSSNVEGFFNIAIGSNALSSAAAGFTFNNIAIGPNALQQAAGSITNNTAIGADALQNNTTGNNNTAVGAQALQTNSGTFSSRNTAVGSGAQSSNLTGQDNVAVGYQALMTCTIGTFNVAVGSSAMSLATATSDVAVGSAALQNDTGFYNTAVGASALSQNRAGTNNTAVGYLALVENHSGFYNTGIGSFALELLQTGTNNIAIGYYAMQNTNLATSGDVAVGNYALQNDSAGNQVAVGYYALQQNTAGFYNTGVGTYALSSNITGTSNTALGYYALQANTGVSNTAQGFQALQQNTSGNNNTAMGTLALQNATASNDTALGAQALQNDTAGSQVAIGFAALNAVSNAAAVQNTAVGYYAGATGNGANFFHNTAVGYYAMQAATGSSNNTAVGVQALQTNTVNGGNVAVGNFALQGNSSGSNNVAVGVGALLTGTVSNSVALGFYAMSAATSSNSVAVGDSALQHDTAGGQVAIGFNALQNNTSGAGHTAVGFESLSSNITGTFNTGVGYYSLFYNASGNTNTGVGYYSLYNNILGSSNTALGYYSLATQAFNSVSFNTAIGYYSMQNVVTTNDTAVGYQTLVNDVTGNNTAVGFQAMRGNANGGSNIAVGSQAMLNTSANFDVAVGVKALAADTGGGNTAIGYYAMSTNTTGSLNAVLGYYAMQAATAGENTAVGSFALAHDTAGLNTAVGYYALNANTLGNQNVAIGYQAQQANNVSTCIAIGYQALSNNSGNNNIGIGDAALQNASSSAFYNIAIGRGSVLNTVTNSDNIAIGDSAMAGATVSGSSNVAVGVQAGLNVSSGGGNVLIGPSAGPHVATGSNSVCIGNNAGPASDVSAQIYIGTQGIQTACFIAGISGNPGGATANVVVNGSGQLQQTSSSRKLKDNISNITDESSNIYQLTPSKFTFKNDPSHQQHYGFIAEDVAAAVPELAMYDDKNEPIFIHFNDITALLVNEQQKDHARIDQLVIRNHELMDQIRLLQEQLNTLGAQVMALQAA